MNEKRAFLMMVGLGLLAIITNGVALIDGGSDIAVVSQMNGSDQAAQVVAVPTQNLTNFALGKEVKGKYGALGQVSSYCVDCGSNLTLDKAVDDNLETIWCSSKTFNNTDYSSTNDDWVRVDLGKNMSISQIGVRLADGNPASPKCNLAKNYQIRVQQDGSATWATVGQGSNNTSNLVSAIPTAPVVGRYVELRMTKSAFNNSHLGVKEFRVWGELPDLQITKVERDPTTGKMAISIKNNGGVVSAPFGDSGKVCLTAFSVSSVGGNYLIDRFCLLDSAYPIKAGGTVTHKFSARAYNGLVYIGLNGTALDVYKLPTIAFASYPSEVLLTESNYSNNSFIGPIGPYTGEAPVTAASYPQSKASLIDLGDGGTYSDEYCPNGGTYFRNKWTGTIRIGNETKTDTFYRYTAANLKVIGSYLGGVITWGDAEKTVTARGKCISLGQGKTIEIDPPIKFRVLGIINLFQTESAWVKNVTYTANGDDWGTVTEPHREPKVEDPQLQAG